jgi:hypothetical protein
MWIVTGEVKKDHRRYQELVCSVCSFVTHTRATKTHSHIRCKKCYTIERNRTSAGKHRGVGHLTKTFYNYFNGVAKRRNIVFSVGINELWELALRQELRCALSGIVLDFPKFSDGCGNFKRSGHTASLDRIDSGRGYVTGNVQWVHKIVNIMKNGLSQNEFVLLCHAIALRHANPEPSDLKGMKLVRSKVQRLTDEDPRPIIPTRAPSSAQADDEIAPHSLETRRATC